MESQAAADQADPLEEDAPEVCSQDPGFFSQWLEAGCSPSALDDLDLVDENPAEPHGDDASEFEEVEEEQEELQHYAAYYQANYTTSPDGGSYQHSRDKGYFLC